jgi:hypothetical protein
MVIAVEAMDEIGDRCRKLYAAKSTDRGYVSTNITVPL